MKNENIYEPEDYIDAPIFLHFINRELLETENARFSEIDIFNFIKVSLFLTDSYAFIGNALVWECYHLFPKAIKFLCDLEKNSLVYFVGGEQTLNSFLIKRRKLYEYDKKRYPIYFNDRISEKLWGRVPIKIDGDTTNILAKNLFELIINYENNCSDIRGFTNKDIDIIYKQLGVKLNRGVAITYSLFKKTKMTPTGKNYIKKLIISYYTERYKESLNGKIIANIPGIPNYGIDDPVNICYDYQFNWMLLNKLKLIDDLEMGSKCDIERILKIKEAPFYRHLLIEIRKFTLGIYSVYINEHIIPQIYLSRVLSNIYLHDYDVIRLCFELNDISKKLCSNVNFAKGYLKMNDFRRDILILTANSIEYKTARKVAKQYGFIYNEKILEQEDYSYTDCMEENSVKVYIARTFMGSLNSAMTVQQFDFSLNPKYVIMGGICAGLNPKKQKIGDILISDRICQYDFVKESSETRILRGDIITSNRFLRERFEYEAESWNKCNVDSGLIVSSSVLANSEKYINHVLDELPDALGFEMEGAGLIQSCQLLQDKWVLVKSICDWGHDKTDDSQAIAAENAFEFIFSTIRNRIMQL